MWIVPPEGILEEKVSWTLSESLYTFCWTLDEAAAALVWTAKKALVIATSILDLSKFTTDPFLLMTIKIPGYIIEEGCALSAPNGSCSVFVSVTSIFFSCVT